MTFVDYVTPVPADWLNNVNTVVNNIGTLPPTSQIQAAITYTQTAPPAATLNNVVAELARSDHKNVIDYGADPTGAAFSDTAVAQAIAACPIGHVAVYFPPGKYKFQNPIVYTCPTTDASISFYGSGGDTTVLSWGRSNAPGISVTFISPYNSCRFRDMTIASSIPSSANTGIFVNQTGAVPNPANSALNEFSGMVFRGLDGYVVADGWAFGVELSGVSNVNFNNCLFVGPTAATTGVFITATATILGVVINFIGCSFNYIGVGISYAQWVQGVTVCECNFTGGTNGILIPPGQPGIDELMVTLTQFNVTNTGILCQTVCESTTILGNLFIIPNNGIGILLTNPGLFNIVGNSIGALNIGGPNTTGVLLQGTSTNGWPGIITGNTFQYLTDAGIFIDTGVTGVNIQSNVYFNNTSNIVNHGTGNTLGGGSI